MIRFPGNLRAIFALNLQLPNNSARATGVDCLVSTKFNPWEVSLSNFLSTLRIFLAPLFHFSQSSLPIMPCPSDSESVGRHAAVTSRRIPVLNLLWYLGGPWQSLRRNSPTLCREYALGSQCRLRSDGRFLNIDYGIGFTRPRTCSVGGLWRLGHNGCTAQ